MGLHQTLQSLAGTTFQSATTSNDDIIHALMLREARDRGVALPTGGEPQRYKFHGGYVFPPRAGLHTNVSYLDIWSLYPNLIRTINLSPETIIGTDDERRRMEFEVQDGRVVPFGVDAETFLSWDWTSVDQHGVPREACVWSYIDTRPVKWLQKGESYGKYTDGRYKMVFDPDKGKIRWRDDHESVREHSQRCYFLAPRYVEGFVPSLIDDLLQLKDSYEGEMYDAVKAIINSVFGTLGFSSYKYETSFSMYDWRIAESVTLAGRRVIKFTANSALKRLQSRYDEDTVYIAIGDTDGCGIAIDADVTRGHVLPYVHETAEWLNDEAYDEFVTDEFGVDEHWMEVEVESYAARLFVPNEPTKDGDEGTRKRYAQRITWKND